MQKLQEHGNKGIGMYSHRCLWSSNAVSRALELKISERTDAVPYTANPYKYTPELSCKRLLCMQ